MQVASTGPRRFETQVDHRWLTAVVFGLALFLVGRAVTWNWTGALELAAKTDHRIYMAAADRIIAGGPMYPEWQLSGPYTLEQEPELYPPPTLLFLIVPLSVLPDPVWWVMPLSVLAAVTLSWRPSILGWIGILACFVPPWSWDGIAAGGLFMWCAAFLALGTRWPAFSVGVLLKPALAPFALFGVRRPPWWIGLAIAVIAAALTLPAWPDYVRVLTNLQGASLFYAAHNVPLLLVPLIAWWTRSQRGVHATDDIPNPTLTQ